MVTTVLKMKGVDPNARSSNLGETPLHLAASSGSTAEASLSVISALLDAGNTMNSKGLKLVVYIMLDLRRGFG